jgi:hypothetical protein
LVRLWSIDDGRFGKKEPNMILIGVDFHPSVQQVAYVDTETGETCERRLNHSDGEAERFYRDLDRTRISVPSLELVFGWFRLQ